MRAEPIAASAKGELTMDRNIGPEDRVVRVVVGIALAIVIYVVNVGDIAKMATVAVAAYLLVSGLLARCLVYKLLGVDTSVQEQPYSTTDDRAF